MLSLLLTMVSMLTGGCTPLGDPPDCADGPVGPALLTNLEPAAPLAFRLDIEEGLEVGVGVQWSEVGGEHGGSVDYAAAEAHAHTLVGFRTGRDYDVDVTLSRPSGRETVERCRLQTPAMLPHFPRTDVVVAEQGAYEPGDTLVSMRFGPSQPAQQDLIDPNHEIIAVYDEQGELIWWMNVPVLIQDVGEYEGGLIFLAGVEDPYVSHVGWDGQEIQRWTVGKPKTGLALPTSEPGNLHHEITPVPGEPGHLMSIVRTPDPDIGSSLPSSYAVGECPRLSRDELGNGRAAIDFVVEFTEAGQVVDETWIGRLIPEGRLGCNSLGGTIPEDWKDWLHTNAVLVDDEQLIVSIRNQDVVLAIDRQSKRVNWMLGHPGGWTEEQEERRLQPLDPDMRWSWHQHAPMFGPDLPDGRRHLILFDNANFGAAPPDTCCEVSDAPGESRVVGYAIDEEALTVEETFSFDRIAGSTFFSRAVGDADWLPGGTILSTWGFLTNTPSGERNLNRGLGNTSVRLVEFDPDTLQEVWHLYLWSTQEGNPYGWTASRAERIAPLTGRAVD